MTEKQNYSRLNGTLAMCYYLQYIAINSVGLHSESPPTNGSANNLSFITFIYILVISYFLDSLNKCASLLL